MLAAVYCLVMISLSDGRQALQQMLLAPLVDMGATTLHFDIRAKQIECTLAILHAGVAGESLSHGWQQILSIIGNITDNQGYDLDRMK